MTWGLPCGSGSSDVVVVVVLTTLEPQPASPAATAANAAYLVIGTRTSKGIFAHTAARARSPRRARRAKLAPAAGDPLALPRTPTWRWPMARTHYLPDEQVHFTWDAGNEPRVVVESGDTVVVWTRDVSDNQITPESDTSVIAGLDWDRIYPLNGPIGIGGAEPGDTLAVEILDIRTQGWG